MKANLEEIKLLMTQYKEREETPIDALMLSLMHAIPIFLCCAYSNLDCSLYKSSRYWYDWKAHHMLHLAICAIVHVLVAQCRQYIR